MLLFNFQALILALIILSFVMLIAIPVLFASPNGWDNNKPFVLISSGVWLILVFSIGILNSSFI